ncbi:MAG: hypothetical protein M1557_02830, partial [Actinobacteria bacterium]|nr:hypothetical protein [Actinomycetota bacterium]
FGRWWSSESTRFGFSTPIDVQPTVNDLALLSVTRQPVGLPIIDPYQRATWFGSPGQFGFQ